MAGIATLDDLAVAGQRVLVRADLNVPMRDGEIGDMTRIDRLLPTLRDLLSAGARIIVMSHFGRPKGKAEPALSLRPIAETLSGALDGLPVQFAEECIGTVATEMADGLQDGEILLLENLRFHAEEEQNDLEFASALASLGDVYVDDAFSCAHRAHASVAALASLLPSGAGRGMQAELEALEQALESPARPLAAIVGGAKVSTKLDLLQNMISKVDILVIGGAMANTFLHAQGVGVGKSLHEPELSQTALDVLAASERAGCEIILPDQVVAAGALTEGTETVVVDVERRAGRPDDPRYWTGVRCHRLADSLGHRRSMPDAVAKEAARLTRQDALPAAADMHPRYWTLVWRRIRCLSTALGHFSWPIAARASSGTVRWVPLKCRRSMPRPMPLPRKPRA